MGLSFEEFADLTMADYNRRCYGHILKDEREWERTRVIVSTLININSRRKVRPEDIIKLPYTDGRRRKAKGEYYGAFWTRERAQGLIDKINKVQWRK